MPLPERGCTMRRRPISNRELEREIHRAWVDLQRARLDDHGIRIAWHERAMNDALDELGERLSRTTTPLAA